MKAAFLDRDGVINIDRAYVSRWEDFEFVPGAVEAMRALQAAGYALIVVTNQSGLARGYYTEADYQALTARMRQALEASGVHLHGVYHCPHHPKGTVAAWARECDCRKPAPGLIRQAATEHGVSLPQSILIGDKASDIQAARSAGVGRAFLVQSDNPESQTVDADRADGAFADLKACVAFLLTERPERVQATP